MAFCTNCGQKIADDVAFCTNCGKSIGNENKAGADSTAQMPVQAYEQQYQPQPPQQSQAQAQQASRGTNKTAIIIVAILAVVIAAAVIAVVFIINTTGNSDGPGTYANDTRNEQAEDVSEVAESSAQETQSSSDAAEEAITSSGGYIISGSDSRYLTASDLYGLSDYELYLARNEIFARHGRGFKNPDLAQYFASQPWYTQLYTPEQFDALDSVLNDYEQKNSKFIREEEQRRNSPYLN